MARLSDLYPSNYLKASDLQGKEVTVKIREVTIEEVGHEKEQKPVVYFEGAGKGLVLNKTNATAIGDHYGDDTDGWIGKQIILFAMWVDFKGRSTQAVRVRGPEPAQKTAAVVQHPAAPIEQPAAQQPQAASTGEVLNDSIPF